MKFVTSIVCSLFFIVFCLSAQTAQGAPSSRPPHNLAAPSSRPPQDSAWRGSGTQTDPYLISTTDDWRYFARQVSAGYTFAGQTFKMTADIDAEGKSAGTELFPFSGTFDGDGHTLTYSRGQDSSQGPQFVHDYCAPFVTLQAATIRHLNVTGHIYSSQKHAAGIACYIDGLGTTTISDCHVSTKFIAHQNLKDDATFGGIVGLVKSIVNPQSSIVNINNCTFSGSVTGWPARSSGLVGYTDKPITFQHCLFDVIEKDFIDGCATFVRTAPGVQCTFKECYYTSAWGLLQGQPVFRQVLVPDGCTAEIVSPPTITFNGVDYWQSGATIRLSAPDDLPFHHWTSEGNGCFLSNPWQRSGLQTLDDIYNTPILTIANSIPKPYTPDRIIDGTRYRYLCKSNYHLYLSDQYIAQKGYQFDKNGELYLQVDNKKVWVTAVVGWEPGKIPNDGAQIHNDLSGDWRDYTFVACIAPHAFDGCTELKTLYFKDTDANNYNAQTKFDFFIAPYAFANCPNLTEVKMMQYTTAGDNHWEALRPEQVSSVASTVFSGSPLANFSTDAALYQSYLNNDAWKEVKRRIVIYNHTTSNMEVNGAKYGYILNTNGEPLKNDSQGNDALMETLRYWNADYQQFMATSLLTSSEENIWYTHIVGCDDSYLRRNDGNMRIYNDPGSYYNYKTIAINSLGGSKEVKTIEFWQTNGRSSNSYTNLKIVIKNGAFKDCDNLKELRLFYFVEDGDDHWQVLGPTDVIPGDNIFGEPTLAQAEEMTEEQLEKASKPPHDFKILVSPSMYIDFINDPNWVHYLPYIEPVEYDPDVEHGTKTFDDHHITYGYMTSPGGIGMKSQVVSTDFSWWTLLKWGWTVISYIPTVKGIATAVSAAREAARSTAEVAALQTMQEGASQALGRTTEALTTGFAAIRMKALIADLSFEQASLQSIGIVGNQALANQLLQYGIVDQTGKFVVREVTNHTLILAGRALKEGLTQSVAQHTAKISSILFASGLNSFGTSTAKAALKTAGSYAFFEGLFGAWGAYTGQASGQPGIDVFREKGMRANLLSNIHKWGSAGYGMVYQTPHKNLVYHTYIKAVPDTMAHAIVSVGRSSGQGTYATTRTSAFSKSAFQGKKNLRKVSFHDDGKFSSETGMPLCISIPDSAFVGCDALQELSLLLTTDDYGEYPLGPENFVLCGDSIFAGLKPAQFHIVIDPSRKQDFLDNETWAPLEPYFTYRTARPKTQHTEYGVHYAFVYEGNSVKKEHKEGAHLIEHTLVNGVDNNHLDEHSGTAMIINDIGTWNNFQLDYVAPWAFQGNDKLRNVQFIDLLGWGPFGAAYTGLKAQLTDSCFANCPNLETVDLLYGVTDQKSFLAQIGGLTLEADHIEPMTPEMIQIGKGVFHGSPKARLKMMPQQLKQFMADSNWVAYKDRFLPCVITTGDEGLKKTFRELRYYNPSGSSPEYWDDVFDLSRILGKPGGFDWLKRRLSDHWVDFLAFPEFEAFECLGLDYVGEEWFYGCSRLATITLPKTIKRIGKKAFYGCHLLYDIELPAAVTRIDSAAFQACSKMRSVIINSTVPPELAGDENFPSNQGMKIYVPDASLQAYLTNPQWQPYKDYILPRSSMKLNKVITLDKPGQLAEKLGLTLSFTESFVKNEIRFVYGDYTRYDSLTISGPLNGLDMGVIRYLAGCDVWTDRGKYTGGKLRYLNLYDAHILKDLDIPMGNMTLAGIYTFEDDIIVSNCFNKCIALETVILPRTLKAIYAYAFRNCTNLRKLAICNTNELEYNKMTGSSSGEGLTAALGIYSVIDAPLDELMLYTEQPAECKNFTDPWKHNIQMVYTLPHMVPTYQTQTTLINRTSNIAAPFQDRAVIDLLARQHLFFPSEYILRESVEGVFQGDTKLTAFDDFYQFVNVRQLHETFKDCSRLQSITLPDSLQRIGRNTFAGCTSLRDVTITTAAIPELEPNTFDKQVSTLHHDFKIHVPKKLCKQYRTQWAQYAEYIEMDDNDYDQSDIIEINTPRENTLAWLLGLRPEISTKIKSFYSALTYLPEKYSYITDIKGKYDHIRKLKVSGPISGHDLAVLRFLAGWCPWGNTRNYNGHLEYLDLYNATLKASDAWASADKTIWAQGVAIVQKDHTLPPYALLKAYNLKTLILPKSCTSVETRALQECEGLEVLVVGDSCKQFVWNALDDDAMLTRMYILSKQKMNIKLEDKLPRWLSNNYNPTFDAIYVRPSLYEQYANDWHYISDYQTTNLISKGIFNDDASFCAFASHAAATVDDIASVTDISKWFNSHRDVKSLVPLRYSSVTTIDDNTFFGLKELQDVSLPPTLTYIGEDAFKDSQKLRYVDFLLCDSANIISKLHNGGISRLGIDTQRTLVYLPESYGPSDGTNIVTPATSATATTLPPPLCPAVLPQSQPLPHAVPPHGPLPPLRTAVLPQSVPATALYAQSYRLVDGEDYCVPYPFHTDSVYNSRLLPASAVPYTLCLPYTLTVPPYTRAYKLTDRQGTTLIFSEVKGTLEAMTPYLLKVVGNKRLRKTTATLSSDIHQTIPASGENTLPSQTDAPGYTLRGSFHTISNHDAAELGAYILQSDGDWHPVTKKAQPHTPSILPFRAFLLLSARNTRGTITMTLQDNDGIVDHQQDAHNDIDTIVTVDADGKRQYYDINGRRINAKPLNGIYIHNGKKYIKK